MRRSALVILSLFWWTCFLATIPVNARVEIKPGFNLFSPQQDVQLGQEAAQEVEKELQVVSDAN